MRGIILLCVFALIFSFTYGQRLQNGIYIGLEEICSTDSLGNKDCFTDPSRPKRKWYHLTTLKIKNDSVFVDQVPVSIHKKDTAFSASDGAFFYYSGTYRLTGNVIKIDLKELFCHYCGELLEKQNDGTYKRVYMDKQYSGIVTENGIMINNYLFRKTGKVKYLLSEYPPEKE